MCRSPTLTSDVQDALLLLVYPLHAIDVFDATVIFHSTSPERTMETAISEAKGYSTELSLYNPKDLSQLHSSAN